MELADCPAFVTSNVAAGRPKKNRLAKARRLTHCVISAPNPMSPANPDACTPSCLLAPAGEARWFAEQIRPHELELRAYLRGRFPMIHEVDDLVQETYARLVSARAAGHATLTRAYMFVVARNLALDLIRRRRTVSIEFLGNVEELSVVEERPDAAEVLSHEQELALLADAMRALPPRCREILRLRRIEGLSHRAIAERLGIAEGTVNAQLAIGVMRCRRYLCAQGVVRAGIHVPEPSPTDERRR